jgi:predicted Zn-dependent protease
MKLDAEGRKLRAKKAARAQVKNRQARTNARDVGLIAALHWLQVAPQPKKVAVIGIKFLADHGLSPNLPDDKTVWRYLADATGLTQERIRQIWAAKSKLARLPHKTEIQPDLFGGDE